MKHFLRIAALFAFCALFAPTAALATNCGTGTGTCFAIATGNWNAGATWSDSSAGATCSATCTTGPAAGDAVTLDAGTNTKNVTVNANSSIATLVSTCTTCTLTHSSGITLTISGNTFTLSSGMTYTFTGGGRILKFSSTSGTALITTAGKTVPGLVFDGVGGTFQLQDNLAFGSAATTDALTLTNGTFDANGFNVTGPVVSSTNANTRNLTMGSGTWTVNGVTSVVWDLTNNTGLTLSATSSTLIFSGAAISSRTANLGTSKSYGTVTVANTGSNPYRFDLVAVTAITIATLNFTSPVQIFFASSITYTITNAVTWAGSSSSSPIILQGTGGATPTLALAASSTMNWAVIGGIAFTGSPVASNSFAMPGNSGITINGPSGGASGGRIIGG